MAKNPDGYGIAGHRGVLKPADHKYERARTKADVYVLDLVWMAQFVDRGYIRRLNESELSGAGMCDFLIAKIDTSGFTLNRNSES